MPGREREAAFVLAVLRWWEEGRKSRDTLPWRQRRDPWAVLVSEVMLTQTQVARVAVRFPLFIERYPTADRCARAKLASVIRAWSGLGYNRRAKSLHEAAGTIVSKFSGRVPSKCAELESLRGVGPYISRAVAAFAFNEDVAPIDSNVRRVLERAIAGSPLSMPRAQEIGNSLVPLGAAREWGLALMDFGSLVCSARTPRCSDCPVLAVGACVWRSETHLDGDPRTKSRPSQRAFSGSDRDIRGRLVRAACNAPIRTDALASFDGPDSNSSRVHEIAARLVAEGLLVRGDRGDLRLA